LSLNPSQFVKSKFGSWLFALFFLWIAIVLIEFFIHCPEVWWSLPLSPLKTADLSKFLKVLGEFLSTVLISVWFLALMGWTGHQILRVFGRVKAHQTMTFCLEMGLGIFFWILFWFGLGLTRLWFGPLWLGVMILMSLWAVPDLFQVIRNLGQMEKPRFPLWFVALILIYGLAALVHGLLPDVFYDSLNYFLGLPQFWIYQHGITDNAQQLLSGYFYGGSMFFMGGWMLADTEGAVLLSAAVWGLCGVLAYGWAEELSDKKTAVVAAAAVLTFPLLYLNGWAVRVDGLFAFVSLLFLYGLTKALTDNSAARRRWLFLAALFAGLAVFIKPTAVVLIAAAFSVLIVRREKKMSGEWGFTFLVFSFWALLLVGPSFLKNWAFAGNPFFPYAYSWMGGRSLPLNGYHRLLWENQQSLPMDHGLWSWINLFWRLSMPGEGNNQIIGPLVLAFLPGLFLFKLKETQKFLVWVTVVSFVLGFALSHMLRFSMPSFLSAFILFSVVFLAKETPAVIQWSWKISVWVFAVFFLGAYAVISTQYYPGWDRWTGQERREAYLNQTISNSYEPLVLWVDKNLSTDARLLIVGDARGLYYPRFFYANSVFDEPFLVKAARQEKDSAGILKQLHQWGITHVVINGLEGLRLSADYRQYEMTPAEWAKLNDLVNRGLKPLYWKNFQVVYEVKDKLNEEKQPYVLNLFSFLPPTAYDFSQAVQTGDKAKAHAALLEQIKFFPQEQYWRAQLKTQ
jgi:hypothetical protein